MRRMLGALIALLAVWSSGLAAQTTPERARAYALARGEERILRFRSDVRIARNGDLDVTETIHLVSLADQIRHGINRDFPTSYSNGAGRRIHVGFRLLSVDRDGHAEPHQESALANGIRIRIGDAEATLPPGEHRYVIRYVTTRQISYGDTADELYWNATGTDWAFPIDVAEARIALPAAIPFGARAAYTGPDGSTARDAAVTDDRPGIIGFRTTVPLARGEGLTVAAAFPKHVLETPDRSRRARWWLEDWGALAAGLAATLLLVGYYLCAWWRAGRGPRPGPVVPRFTPPDDLGAAAMRYIRRMAIDDRALTAAIVDLGVQRQLRVTREDGGWFQRDITTLTRTPNPAALPTAERATLEALFAGGAVLELKQSNHGTLQAARSALEAVLKGAHEGRLISDNRAWARFGAVLVPAAVLAAAWVALFTRAAPTARLELLLPPVGLAALATGWWLYDRFRAGGGAAKMLAGVGLLAVIAVAALATVGTLGSALSAGDWPVLLPLATLPLVISAFHWMAAPTAEGRAALDRIEGFRQYLGITEEDRFETLHPPAKTPELFERYLPHAIALDVENRWTDRFAATLATAAAAGSASAVGSWYHGDNSLWDDPGGFSEAVGSSLSSTVASAASAPSKSSGSGGGGSSGGGGGGGGGSGW